MGKNIVLCADGTGNKGGYTPDSNVYKIYKAVDIHNKGKEQITFYDNGIGTETNKYVRAAAGALGLGFKKNVCDLYHFLARNYVPGDQIYLFGFSRGASTIRAFTGFVATCGLVDGKEMKEDDLWDRVKDAYKAYVKFSKKRSLAEKWREGKSRNIIPIKFIGVWDTVSSLGFPQRWFIPSIGMLVLNIFFKVLDYLSDPFFPHRFYNYKLTENVEFAYQALAIDDARTSFWPRVWNETNHPKPVEQVWFAGMHSNVGGGYHRAGMAHVALEWMMIRAKNNDLIFKDNALKNVHDDAHAHGRIYDSRDGFAIFYRYHPRKIEKLCHKKMDKIKIHESVIERMERKTANYAPGNLPMEFDVVANDGTVTKTISKNGSDGRKKLMERINKWVFLRKCLYVIFLESTMAVVVFVLLWKNEPWPPDDSGVMGFLGDNMRYVLPNFIDEAISVAVIQHLVYFLGAFSLLIICWILRNFSRRQTVIACEELREKTLAALKENQK